MTVRVEPLGRDRFEASYALRSRAFTATPQPFDPERPELDLERDQLLGAFDGERMVGTATVYDLGQHIGGRRVPMGGVAGVAIAPDARGTGAGQALMRRALDGMRDRGHAVSTLYPATTAFYRLLGWELAGSRTRWTVATDVLARLPRPANDVAVRALEWDDLAVARAVYDRVAARESGWLDRDDLYWRWIRWEATRSGAGHTGLYVAERAGEAVGYLRYHHVAEDPRFYGLVVDDLACVEPDATLALLRLLAGNRSVTHEVELVQPPERPLLFLLPEQTLRSADDWVWMTRIVDVAGAVAARGYPPGVRARVEVEVDDREVAANAGRWRIEVEDGRGTAERGGDGRVRLGVGALASLYTGWSAPRGLAALGALQGATDADLDALGAMFAGPTPWMPDFF